MTVDEIITRALKIIGAIDANEDLDTTESTDGRLQINGIIDEWNIDKFRSYTRSKINGTLVPGQSEYTIGIGGDINAERPVRIEDMYITRNNQDYKVMNLTFEDYNNIINKSVDGDIPFGYFYEPSYPFGKLKFTPTPSEANTITITQWFRFGEYTAGDSVVALPPGFTELLTYKLAVEMCSYYSKQVPPEVMKKLNNLEYKIDSLVSDDWTPSFEIDTPVSNNGVDYRTYIPKNY